VARLGSESGSMTTHHENGNDAAVTGQHLGEGRDALVLVLRKAHSAIAPCGVVAGPVGVVGAVDLAV